MASTLHVVGNDLQAFEMPLSVRTLAEFRQWSHSETFPEQGRIDFLGGRIEVDMSPERLFSHGRLKVELVRRLADLVDQRDSGILVSDRTRVASVCANLSVEPDVAFVSHASIASRRVELIAARNDDSDFVEIQGGPDLVVEIVSDSSVVKDTQTLPGAYFSAGVSEYWLADARGESLVFRIQQRGESAFEQVTRDSDGYQLSHVMGAAFRLERLRDRHGYWRFQLLVRV